MPEWLRCPAMSEIGPQSNRSRDPRTRILHSQPSEKDLGRLVGYLFEGGLSRSSGYIRFFGADAAPIDVQLVDGPCLLKAELSPPSWN